MANDEVVTVSASEVEVDGTFFSQGRIIPQHSRKAFVELSQNYSDAISMFELCVGPTLDN